MTADSQPPIADDNALGAPVPRRRRRAQKAEPQIESASTMIRHVWLERLSHFSLIAGIVVLVVAVIVGIIGVQHPAQVIAMAPAPIQTILPTILPLPTSTPTATPTPLPPLVGLLAGHSGGADTGAICPDGLREVDITKDVANRAKQFLQARGYRVDILAEFDKRLDATKRDYSPAVFLAIHVDSCVFYASGYKVARADNSVIPEEDDRLTKCVSWAYSAATQLPFHAGSITTDMTHYHGLEEIDPKTPGAIIELGFMGSDRAVLNKRETLALGIADGIDGFLKGSACQ